MRLPQIVVFERGSQLAGHLGDLAASRRWLLREARQGPACANLLRRHRPSVLVLKVGRNLLTELNFLYEVQLALPDLPIIAVGDSDDVLVQLLALELGATMVLQPPLQPLQLIELVDRAMQTMLARWESCPGYHVSMEIDDGDANEAGTARA